MKCSKFTEEHKIKKKLRTDINSREKKMVKYSVKEFIGSVIAISNQ